MGLYVHSLAELPIEAKRSYYVYLLDYGWEEPLSNALFRNFQHMAKIASDNDAVVIRGLHDSVHFADEVFSWHNVNGESGEKILPAILVTNKHPEEFRRNFGAISEDKRGSDNFKIVVFPLKKYCKTTTDVIDYVEKIFEDIIERKSLSEFRVATEMKKGLGKAFVDGLIMKPAIAGFGYDFKSLIQYFTDK